MPRRRGQKKRVVLANGVESLVPGAASQNSSKPNNAVLRVVPAPSNAVALEFATNRIIGREHDADFVGIDDSTPQRRVPVEDLLSGPVGQDGQGR